MKINTDRLVGLTAMFVAVASLVALVYQTHLMQRHPSSAAYRFMPRSTGTVTRLGSQPYLLPKIDVADVFWTWAP